MAIEYPDVLSLQREVIKAAISVSYGRGRRTIASWDALAFHLSTFNASQLACRTGVTYATARWALLKLAKRNEVEKISYVRALVFRLPRAVCDELAGEVLQELLGAGLPLDKDYLKGVARPTQTTTLTALPDASAA